MGSGLPVLVASPSCWEVGHDGLRLYETLQKRAGATRESKGIKQGSCNSLISWK